MDNVRHHITRKWSGQRRKSTTTEQNHGGKRGEEGDWGLQTTKPWGENLEDPHVNCLTHGIQVFPTIRRTRRTSLWRGRKERSPLFGFGDQARKESKWFCQVEESENPILKQEERKRRGKEVRKKKKKSKKKGRGRVRFNNLHFDGNRGHLKSEKIYLSGKHTVTSQEGYREEQGRNEGGKNHTADSVGLTGWEDPIKESNNGQENQKNWGWTISEVGSQVRSPV